GSSPATTARTRTTSAPRTGGTAGTPTTGLDLVTPAPNALSADVPPAAVTTTTAPRGQVAAAHIGTDDDNSVSGGLAALGLAALIGATAATAATLRRRRGSA